MKRSALPLVFGAQGLARRVWRAGFGADVLQALSAAALTKMDPQQELLSSVTRATFSSRLP
jgi:hypothetical protein